MKNNVSNFLILILSFALLFFSVSCDKKVFTGLVEDEPIDNSFLIVDSRPTGFTVFIDQKNMGINTPDTVTNLSSGLHTLTLKNEMWADTNIVISLERNKSQNVYVDVLANINLYGWLICNSIPSGAQIFLNDNSVNFKTPAVIKGLIPGTYKAKLILKNYRADSAVVKVKGKQFTYYNSKLEDTSKIVNYMQKNSGIPSDGLNSICIDSRNVKWFGSIDKGVIKFDGTNWSQVYIPSGIPQSLITSLHYDENRNQIWLGTANGLAMFNGTNWSDMSSYIASKYVYSIIQDRFNKIWIGTIDGLFCCDGNYWKVYNFSNSGLRINKITCLAPAADGTIWVGTPDGTYRFGNNEWTHFAVNTMDLDANLSSYIQAIAVDKEGWVWVYHAGDPAAGTISELVIYKNESWNYFRGLPVSYQPNIQSFLIDEKKNIWMAAKNGLTRYSKTSGALTFTANESNLSSNECYSVRIDLNGDAWIATMGGGAVKLKKGNF